VAIRKRGGWELDARDRAAREHVRSKSGGDRGRRSPSARGPVRRAETTCSTGQGRSRRCRVSGGQSLRPFIIWLSGMLKKSSQDDPYQVQMDAYVAAAEGSNTQSGILCTYEDAVRTYELVSTLHLRHMHMLIAVYSELIHKSEYHTSRTPSWSFVTHVGDAFWHSA
jgi:hypothetical protein